MDGLLAALAPFQRPDQRLAVWQLLTSVIPYAVGWLLMAYSLRYGYWLTCLLAIPTAGFFLRLFMIQHDCGHGSFLPSRQANDALGFMLGVLTFTPYAYWRKTHAIHHATSGDLNRRGFGDITTLTVKEYDELSKTRQWSYRCYRHPFVMFGLGVFFQFLVKHRLPWNIPSHWKREWRSVHLTNLALALVIGVLVFTMGLKAFLLVLTPVMLMASACGSWLFYVQHQFEDAYWCQSEQWDFHQAALQGSSYYELPRLLQWFTANIGFHHVHHLNSRIPNYHLEHCLTTIPELQQATRVRLGRSWRLASLKLWDEDRQQLVGF
jgi:omega-6 fatty acid desaturase (delta-12 desaturase)